MPDCKRCGVSLGFLSADMYCKKCKTIVREEEKQKRIEKNEIIKKVQEEYEIFKQDLILPKVQHIKDNIKNGEKVYLYDNIYIPVDSVVSENKLLDEFSIGPLRTLGLLGWQVVGVVPKTVGIGLTNMSVGSEFGDTWGAGIGGNVMGVHILLKMAASINNISDDFLLDYVTKNIDDLLTPDEAQVLEEILQKATT